MTKETSRQQPPISFRDTTIEAQLAMRTPEGESRNQTAKECLDRYFTIMAHETGSAGLNAREWVALKIAMVERHFKADQPLMLGMSVYDSFQAGALSADWDDKGVIDFMDKLDGLGRAQQWAIVDTLERWRITGD